MTNARSTAIFGGHPDPEHRDNLIEAFFADANVHRLFCDWEAVSDTIVALFRLDFARHANEPDVQALVERLCKSSSRFAQAWDEHRVRAFPSSVRELQHPIAGMLRLEPTTYAVLESPGLRLLMYTSYDDETRERITALANDLRAGRVG